MLGYVAARVGQALLTLLASSVIVFALVRTSGSPVDLILPPDSTPAERDAMIRRLGLDRPLAYQYGAFLWSALQGDWGKSLRTGRPATELVKERLANSLKLATAPSRCSGSRCPPSGWASS